MKNKIDLISQISFLPKLVKSLSDIDLAKLLDWYPFLDTQVSAK